RVRAQVKAAAGRAGQPSAWAGAVGGAAVVSRGFPLPQGGRGGGGSWRRGPRCRRGGRLSSPGRRTPGRRQAGRRGGWGGRGGAVRRGGSPRGGARPGGRGAALFDFGPA